MNRIESYNYSALEKAGIPFEALRTLQATITITEMEKKDVMFEITMLFNIQ